MGNTTVKCFKCKKFVAEKNSTLALYRRYNSQSASYRPICNNCAKIDKILREKNIKIQGKK